MMKNIALIILLVLVYGNANAGLAFNQPINVCCFDNIEYAGNSLMTSEGNRFIMWKEVINGSYGWKCNLFNAQYQQLWAEDKVLQVSTSYAIRLISTTDNGVVVGHFTDGIKLLKIDQSGNFPWGEAGIYISGTPRTGIIGDIVPDLYGGVYLTRDVNSSSISQCYLQHVDAEGSLTMESNGILLSNQTSFRSGLLMQQDNSVIVNWRETNKIEVQWFNSTGEHLWEQGVSISRGSWYPYVNTCAFDDGSFAVCAAVADSIFVYHYSQTGVALWANPVTDYTAESVVDCTVDVVLSSDNCLLVHVYRSSSYHDVYIQKIDHNGTRLFPSGVSLSTELYSVSWLTQLMPDTAGGCSVAIVSPSTYLANNNVVVAELSANGVVAYHQVTNDECRISKLSSTQYNGNIYLEWQQYGNGAQGLCVQKLDEDFQGQIPQNGVGLRYGSVGKIEYQCNAAMANGCAILWHQTTTESSNVEARLQMVNRLGEELLPHGGVRVNSAGSSLPTSSQLKYSNGELIVVWEELIGTTYTLRAQIIDDNGQSYYPGIGLELYSGDEGYWSVSLTSHEGDWYILACSSSGVWGQKLSGHVAVWGNGLLLASPNPELTGGINSAYLSFPWLCWKMGSEYLFKQIDTNGITLAQWDDWGMHAPENGWNSGLVTPIGDYLHVLISYPGTTPESPPGYQNMFINSQGEYNLGVSMDYIENYKVMEYEGDALVADNFSGLTIRRYNRAGLFLDSGQISIPFSYNSFVKMDRMTNGNLLCYYYYGHNSGMSLKYLFVTPQLEAENNQLNVVYCNGNNVSPSISTNNDQSWVTWSVGYLGSVEGFSELYLQGILGNSSGVLEQDEPLPTIQNTLKCSPNPFNPQTSINYEVQKGGVTKLEVYDIKGRKVKTLVNESRSPGSYTVAWDGTDERLKKLASGVYILRYKDRTGTETRRLSILK